MVIENENVQLMYMKILEQEFEKVWNKLEYDKKTFHQRVKFWQSWIGWYVEQYTEWVLQGDLLRLISQVRKKYEKGISAEATAEMLEEKQGLVIQIMENLKQFPGLDDEKILERIAKS